VRLRRELEDLVKKGYQVLQLDECVFNTKKMDRRHWAPMGDPHRVRQRFLQQEVVYVLGAISQEAGCVRMFVQDTAFCGADIIAALEELKRFFSAEAEVPQRFAVFWDNASIHKTKEVQASAKRLGIPLLYNLPYRPDLNGIELHWRRCKQRWGALIDSFRANGLDKWSPLGTVENVCTGVERELVQRSAQSGWLALRDAEPIQPEAWEAKKVRPQLLDVPLQRVDEIFDTWRQLMRWGCGPPGQEQEAAQAEPDYVDADNWK
jgi:hypothetical protein